MKQLTLQFVDENKYVLCFNDSVKRELIKAIAKTIIKVNEKEGERNDGNSRAES